MNNLHLIELGQYDKPTITEETNREWIGIGDGNDYYQTLIDCFMNSTTNQSVITGISQQIFGRGLEATDASEKPEQFAQMKGLLKNKDLKKITLDLKMLGEAALQITYKGSKIDKIQHFPRETLRAEKCDENGDILNYYYASDWSKVNRTTELTKIPVFGTKGKGNEVYIIRRYVTGYFYYSPADYTTSYSTLESEISDYLINDAQNSFSGTKVINFNSGIPSEEKMQSIKSQVMNKLSGGFGEKVIVAFNHSSEQKTTVDDIPLNNAPEHYSFLSEECSKKIMLTHRVTSPLLVGLRDLSGGGLGSNAEEIQNAQKLFSNTTIKPYQDLIIESLDEILETNGIALNLYFKTLDPLDFMDIDVVKNEDVIEEETGVKVDEETEIEMMASKAVNPELTDEAYEVILDSLDGETIEDGWEIADVRTYDENNLDVEKWAGNVLETKLAKAVKRKTPIENNPNRFSVLDRSFYKVRYRYAEAKASENTRKFCKQMMQRSRTGVVYRIEDIDITKDWDSVKFKKLGLPMHNNKPFSIFRIKGGANCGHFFQEVLYKVKSKKNKGSDKLKDYDEVESIPKSTKPTPRGHKEAAIAPINTPSRGYVNPPKKKK